MTTSFTLQGPALWDPVAASQAILGAPSLEVLSPWVVQVSQELVEEDEALAVEFGQSAQLFVEAVRRGKIADAKNHREGMARQVKQFRGKVKRNVWMNVAARLRGYPDFASLMKGVKTTLGKEIPSGSSKDMECLLDHEEVRSPYETIELRDVADKLLRCLAEVRSPRHGRVLQILFGLPGPHGVFVDNEELSKKEVGRFFSVARSNIPAVRSSFWELRSPISLLQSLLGVEKVYWAHTDHFPYFKSLHRIWSFNASLTLPLTTRQAALLRIGQDFLAKKPQDRDRYLVVRHLLLLGLPPDQTRRFLQSYEENEGALGLMDVGWSLEREDPVGELEILGVLKTKVKKIDGRKGIAGVNRYLKHNYRNKSYTIKKDVDWIMRRRGWRSLSPKTKFPLATPTQI